MMLVATRNSTLRLLIGDNAEERFDLHEPFGVAVVAILQIDCALVGKNDPDIAGVHHEEEGYALAGSPITGAIATIRPRSVSCLARPYSYIPSASRLENPRTLPNSACKTIVHLWHIDLHLALQRPAEWAGVEGGRAVYSPFATLTE